MGKLKKLCVFCGSSLGVSETYKTKAIELGKLIAEKDIELIYGGGNAGIMGELSRAVLAHGGKVTGVIPKVIYENVNHVELTELIIVDNMHERKAKMYDLADGFIALPGGIGTLEELAEILTWYQIGYHAKPIGIYNVNGFYNSLHSFLNHTISEGFLKQEYIHHIITEDEPTILLEKMDHQEMKLISKWS
ncbi:TIGR00730 family Rossman fold protein [Bacillus sp. PS06]|uniref:LOG family protein n=1 Tax=Bacillus sp. PS06 TaxID=2764176 RepID=UPI001785462A|nr:TIGR00730 family Rossman fold protein [Bacillus sp. PS06]MBD8070799.1 TIGR00730 family Rossman fold protein [Bacillus sp. PS06]